MDSGIYTLIGIGIVGGVTLAWLGWRWGRSHSDRSGVWLPSLIFGLGAYLTVIAVDAAVVATVFDGTCTMILQGNRPCGIVEFVLTQLSFSAILYSPFLLVFVLSFFIAASVSNRRIEASRD